MPTIGLVTVLFKSDEVLVDFFKCISQQTFKDYHLYLIDNSPNDNTDRLIDDLVKEYPITALTHVKNPSNYGVAQGNNQGIELSMKAGTSYTLLLNNDIDIEQNHLIQRLYEVALENKEYLLIPKILFYDTKKIWMAGGTFVDFKGTNLHYGEGDEDGEKYSKVAYFEYAPTCFMLIDNIVFKKIGVMDEKYFVYFDDTDFMYRAKRHGYKIRYQPDITVLHKVSSLTGGSESPFSIYYSNRNRIYYIRKNFKGFKFLVAMSVTLFTRIIKYLRYPQKEKNSLYTAVFDGLKL
jgi:GT2 family glycosyltransferase